MQNLQKVKTLPEIWPIGLLSIGYLILHVINLTIIPIFGDEAIYLSWSQTISEDFKQFFIPLSDGKQPLFMWLTSLATHFFANPLLAPRVISVLAGLFGAIGLYLIAKNLLDRRAGIIAFVFYSLTPILLFYDRMGVPDGLLAVLGIWSFYFGLQLVRQPKVLWAIALGCSFGLAMLTKSPALFYVLLAPSLLLFLGSLRITGKRIISISLLFGLAIFIAGIFYAILRLSSLYPVIGQRQPDFVFGPSHLLTNPLDPFLSRIPEVTGWVLGFVTVPIVVLAVIGLLLGLYKKKFWVLSLAYWFLVPLLLEMALAKGFTPRYFVFTIPYLVLLASLGLVWLGDFMSLYSSSEAKSSQSVLPIGRVIVFCLAVIMLIPAMSFDYYLLTDPATAPIPQKERSGYLEDWTAGYGIAEVSDYIKALSISQKILVGTEGHFGTLPDGLIAYQRKSPNVHVEGMGQAVGIRMIPPALFAWLSKEKGNRSFLVVNKSRMEIVSDAHLRKITEYPKPAGPKGQDSLLFFEVTP